MRTVLCQELEFFRSEVFAFAFRITTWAVELVVVRVVAGNGELADLHRTISTGTGIPVVGINVEGHIVSFQSTAGGDDVQDATNTFGIVFGTRFGDDFDGFHRVGRKAFEYILRVIAHQAIGLPVDMDYETAAAVHLDIVFAVDGHEGYFAEHFQSRIGLGIRVVFYAVRYFVYLSFHQRLLCHYFHSFQHFCRFGNEQGTQVGHRLGFGHGEVADDGRLSYG